MKTVSDIAVAIIGGKFSNDDLRSLHDAIKYAMDRNTYVTKVSLGIGDRVTFSNKAGREISGIITKINQKTVAIKTANEGNWKVSTSLVKKA